jgi:hypothetical protein
MFVLQVVETQAGCFDLPHHSLNVPQLCGAELDRVIRGGPEIRDFPGVGLVDRRAV